VERRVRDDRASKIRNRADLHVILTDGQPPTLVDVLVANPAAPSHTKSYTNGSFFPSLEQEKRSSYPSVPSHLFVPFIISPFGELGRDAFRFLQKLKSIAASRSLHFNPSFWMARLAGKLAHAVSAQIHQYNRSFSNALVKNQRIQAQQPVGCAALSMDHPSVENQDHAMYMGM
jgi:hypothetical protein